MIKKARKYGVLAALIIMIIISSVGIIYLANEFYKAAYPKKYSEYVEKYSKEFNIDENILYAVIKTESDFSPNATSAVGARGLTQIMEKTFDWIKLKLKDKDATYSDMYDAQKNIRYGAFLLGYLYDEFKSYETAAAAYHAGRTATSNWLNNKAYSSDGITLDDIPIKDTQHYVGKVIKSFNIYKKLYQK